MVTYLLAAVGDESGDDKITQRGDIQVGHEERKEERREKSERHTRAHHPERGDAAALVRRPDLLSLYLPVHPMANPPSRGVLDAGV